MSVDPRSISFIVSFEDGDQSYYEKTESHWDWPGSASGPTIGVGYDCGYTTRQQCIDDWHGIVDERTLNNILSGVNIKGTAAHMFVMHNRRDITITWAQALQQFTERELPKQEHQARLTLPNWDLLSGLSAGALLSLGYNRGWEGFESNLPRFREMAAIRAHMANKAWYLIPPEITAMVRLWPNVQQLRERRVAEAKMFSDGLPDCATGEIDV
jgi:hypothetical protein